jgi:hypothetical protein
MSDPPPVPPPTTAVVNVTSGWWSKINWTQAVGFICTMLAIVVGHGFEVSADGQLAIVAAIQAVQAVVTVILKTYFTTTVTTSSLRSKGLKL